MNIKVIDSFRGRHRFLSNFGPGDVVVYSQLEQRWVTYASGEHAFNAAKTLDLEERRLVAEAETPWEAKARGRQVTLRDGWDSGLAYRAMHAVQLGKFREGLPITRALLDTGAALLVEGNTWCDQIWGDCRCGKNPQCAPEGKNQLGKILMQVRVERGGRRPTTVRPVSSGSV